MSPFLFILYTNDFTSNFEKIKFLKYADDTAALGMIGKSEAEYRNEIERFSIWCKNNFLDLNVKKTKEIIVDFKKNKQ